MTHWWKKLLLTGGVLLIAGLGLAQGLQTPMDMAESISSVEERRLLFSLKQEREQFKAEMAREQEALALRELELKSLAAEVDKKLEALSQARQELERLLAQKSAEELERINDLRKMYEKMEPAQAAVLLSELDEALAVDILTRMSGKAAGKLLNNMTTDKAARLSTAYYSFGEK